MGYDATCTLTYDGKKTRGTAWLETKDLIFRGPELTGDPLVQRLPAPDSEPETPLEHLSKCGSGLSYDGGVLSVTGTADHSPEERSARQSRADP